MMIDQFKRFCKMKAIGDDHLGIIFFYRNDDPFSMLNGINFFSINDYPDVQKTQEELFFAGNNNIVALFAYEDDLSDLIIPIKSFATRDAPPTRPPSTSGQPNSSPALFAFTLPP